MKGGWRHVGECCHFGDRPPMSEIPSYLCLGSPHSRLPCCHQSRGFLEEDYDFALQAAPLNDVMCLNDVR